MKLDQLDQVNQAVEAAETCARDLKRLTNQNRLLVSVVISPAFDIPIAPDMHELQKELRDVLEHHLSASLDTALDRLCRLGVHGVTREYFLNDAEPDTWGTSGQQFAVRRVPRHVHEGINS
ncbi:hypothetical protein [Hoeflea poritis]|uniref:Uncharacterized protein n=1 Tax=Hoeflea poritis TaxID=2993659 RepID=A0ABT4VMK7_9HYPH|nr:hypothetical protein [Hoeflea poritis]MDA4845938.1 hypothetical protein [Hoeflea poritis]